jgi:hypothetical protein
LDNYPCVSALGKLERVPGAGISRRLRSWRDRFGGELIGLSHDVMNIRGNRKPDTRDTALDLAREQYVYCSDIVDQGVETLSALAAVLMQSE